MEKSRVKMFIWMIIMLVFHSSALDDITDDSIALIFEDNLFEMKFTSFAKTTLRLSRQSNIDLIPLRTIPSHHYQHLIEKIPLNSEEYYTLKLHYKRRSAQNYLMTSIPMCLVLQAQFQYTITLYLNENGYIISTQILTSNSTCHRSNLIDVDEKNELIYRVNVNFQSNEVGPQPETQQFLEKFKREQEAKQLAQESDNRSFLLKYWKYLLPIAVIFILQTVFTDSGSTGGGH